MAKAVADMDDKAEETTIEVVEEEEMDVAVAANMDVVTILIITVRMEHQSGDTAEKSGKICHVINEIKLYGKEREWQRLEP